MKKKLLVEKPDDYYLHTHFNSPISDRNFVLILTPRYSCRGFVSLIAFSYNQVNFQMTTPVSTGVFCFTVAKKYLERMFYDTTFNYMKQNNTPQSVEYFTTAEVMKILKVSRPTLHRWRKKRKIKAKRFQGIVRYKLSDIQKVMK